MCKTYLHRTYLLRKIYVLKIFLCKMYLGKHSCAIPIDSIFSTVLHLWVTLLLQLSHKGKRTFTEKIPWTPQKIGGKSIINFVSSFFFFFLVNRHLCFFCIRHRLLLLPKKENRLWNWFVVGVCLVTFNIIIQSSG